MSTQPPLPTARKSRLAITSLVLGICGLFTCGLSGLPAVAFGVAALVVIKKSQGQIAGQGMAAAGICLGAVSFILLPIALLLPSIAPVRGAGDKAKAGAVVNQLSIATLAYNNEYKRWPQPRTSGELVLIFNDLRDPRTGEDLSQKRPDLLPPGQGRIQFMDFRAKDVTPARSYSKPAPEELAFYDPWGTPYGFAFDNGIGGIYYRGPGTNNPTPWPDTKAGDGVIPLPFASADGGTNVIRAGCAFFSNGPDGLTGTPETEADDIRSWK